MISQIVRVHIQADVLFVVGCMISIS